MTAGGHFLTIHESVVYMQISQLMVEVACFVVTASSNNQIFTHKDSNLGFLLMYSLLFLLDDDEL